jgi:hypothetical protein
MKNEKLRIKNRSAAELIDRREIMKNECASGKVIAMCSALDT